MVVRFVFTLVTMDLMMDMESWMLMFVELTRSFVNLILDVKFRFTSCKVELTKLSRSWSDIFSLLISE